MRDTVSNADAAVSDLSGKGPSPELEWNSIIRTNIRPGNGLGHGALRARGIARRGQRPCPDASHGSELQFFGWPRTVHFHMKISRANGAVECRNLRADASLLLEETASIL